jgi:uncharacterized ferredoxin-like protein
MKLNERDSRHEHVLQVARQMMTAARTAPKGKGVDIIEVMMVTEADKDELAATMRRMGEEQGRPGFLRDADGVDLAECVVLVGTRPLPLGLNCGHCGFPKCALKPKEVPCAVNCVDVGIALGSACATAADWRVDTRVMYSAGIVAEQLGWLEGSTQVYAIPVSASSKNPFFDRKPKA